MTKNRLIVLVLLIGVIAACAQKATSHKESEWHGLTESEAVPARRQTPRQIPAENRDVISDKVVAKMRDRGVIVEDSVVPDDASGIVEDAEQLAKN